MPLKTSNVLRHATTLGNNFISHVTMHGIIRVTGSKVDGDVGQIDDISQVVADKPVEHVVVV